MTSESAFTELDHAYKGYTEAVDSLYNILHNYIMP